MYIARIDFTRVGRWANRSYKLGRGLNVVFGRNEAGKSTARRGIEAMLFTPEPKELASLVSPLSNGTFEATLHARREGAGDAGEESLVLRRQAGRLSLDDGRSIQPDLLDAWLWGTRLVDFRALYSLDGNGLRSPDFLSRKRGGSFGALLLELETAGRDLGELRSELEAELAVLYKKGGSKQTLNRQLEEVRSAAARRDALEHLAGYEPYRRALDEQRAARDALAEAKGTIQQMRRELEALIEVQSAPQRLTRIEEDERAVADLVATQSRTNEAWCVTFEKIESRVEAAHARLAASELAVRSARDACAGRPASTLFMPHDREVTEVVARRRDLLDAPAKRAHRERQRDLCVGELLDVLRAVPIAADAEWALANVDTLAGAREDQAASSRGRTKGGSTRISRLRDAYEAFSSSRADHQAADVAMRKVSRKLSSREREVADLGAALPIEALEAATMKERPLAKEAFESEESRADLEDQRRRLRLAASRLGFREPIDLNACAGVRIPDAETCASIADCWKDAGTQLEAANREAVRCEKDRTAAQRVHRTALSKAPRGATREQIEPLRKMRDAAIHACESPVRAARVGEALSKLRSVEQELDALVDLVLDHARAVEAIEHARLDAETKGAAKTEADERVPAAERLRAVAETKWTDLWTDCPMAVPSIAGHTIFLREHASFLSGVEALAGVEVKQATRVEALRARRVRLLELLGESTGKKASTLDDSAIDALLDTERKRRVAHNTDRTQTLGRARDAQRAAADAREALDAARGAFETANDAFLASVESDAPEFVARELDVASRWVQAERTVRDKALRLRDAVGALAEFDETQHVHSVRVDALVSILADAGLGSFDAFKTASTSAQLDALERAQLAAHQMTTLEAALSKAERDLAAAGREHGAAYAAWEAHLQTADRGAPASPCSDESRAFAERARRIIELDKRIAAAKASFSGGLERASAVVAGRSSDAIASEIDERRVAVDCFDEGTRQVADERLTHAGEAVAAIEGAADLATLTQQVESQVASLLPDLDEVLALKGAIELLTEAERLVQGRQTVMDVLASASRYLAQLTSGSFGEVVLDDAVAVEEHARLQVIRNDDGATRLEVAELSEGTRDQLWLALRLAFLEHNLGHKRLPIILDDVLVHFDDVRGKAALVAIAELAKHTQVILFTHEPAILERARAAGVAFEEVILPDMDTDGASAEPRVLEPRMPTAREARESRAEERHALGDGQDAVEEIYRVLSASSARALGRSEILAQLVTPLDPNRFPEAMNRLKEAGRVLQTGERRGAKYAANVAPRAAPTNGTAP